MVDRPLKVSVLGTAAFLLDPGDERFDEPTQFKVWAAAQAIGRLDWVRDVAPGMNNLLVSFDPRKMPHEQGEALLREAWATAEPVDRVGRTIEIPVTYGGAGGEDLLLLAESAGLTVDETVQRHAAAYRVGAIGGMPGYAYLSGLDPRLALPRRGSPRLRVEVGSIIIGGVQAAIMPCTAPSGWHILGSTAVRLFDASSPTPCRLAIGDTVRFTVAGVLA